MSTGCRKHGSQSTREQHEVATCPDAALGHHRQRLNLSVPAGLHRCYLPVGVSAPLWALWLGSGPCVQQAVWFYDLLSSDYYRLRRALSRLSALFPAALQ